MIMGIEGASALFRSVQDDGTCWLFISLSDGRWVITCDGRQIAEGTSKQASIRSGMQRYLSFTATTISPLEAVCA